MESGKNNNESMKEQYAVPSTPTVGTLDNLSATGTNPDLPGFTDKNLDKHFGSSFDSDHVNQYPHFTKKQYAQRAHDLVMAAVGDNILGYKTASGDIVRFDESTNDSVKGTRNGKEPCLSQMKEHAISNGSCQEMEVQQMIKCPVCSRYEFEADNDFDVCDVCGWENDGVQFDDPDYRGGANRVSLNEARVKWQKLNAHTGMGIGERVAAVG